MQISVLITLALAGNALAQASSAANMKMSASTAEMAMAKTAAAGSAKPTGAGMDSKIKHKVMVSNADGALKFTPDVVHASVGHMVEFMFHPNNHSVAQAAFDSPCMPMDQSKSMAGMTGFFSGFMPVNATKSKASRSSAAAMNMPKSAATAAEANGMAAPTGMMKMPGVGMDKMGMKTFTIMVNSTEPMWFYCSQAKHCQEGMVGVINPKNSSGQTIEAFAAAAKKMPMNVSPSKIAGGCDTPMHARANGTIGAAKASDSNKGVAKGTGKMESNHSMSSTAMSAFSMVTATSMTTPSAAAAMSSSTVKTGGAASKSQTLLSGSVAISVLMALAGSVAAFA